MPGHSDAIRTHKTSTPFTHTLILKQSVYDEDVYDRQTRLNYGPEQGLGDLLQWTWQWLKLSLLKLYKAA